MNSGAHPDVRLGRDLAKFVQDGHPEDAGAHYDSGEAGIGASSQVASRRPTAPSPEVHE